MAWITGLGLLAAAAALALAPAAEPAATDRTPPPATGRERSPVAARAPSSAPTTIDLQALDQARAGTQDDRATARLFAPHSWQPPPPKPPPPPPPEPPRAPPFPYSYFGSMSDEQGLTGFFLQGQRVVAARAGEAIGEFRLDALDARQAVLTHLPLGQTQTIALGKAP